MPIEASGAIIFICPLRLLLRKAETGLSIAFNRLQATTRCTSPHDFSLTSLNGGPFSQG